MPIVILLDVSLSMSRTVAVQDSAKTHTRYSLAVGGINTLLDHLAANSKLEFVALIAFSSLYEVVCPFTRDYDSIRQKLRLLEDFDKTNLDSALHAAYHMILTEWGPQTHAHVIMVTDGCAGVASRPLPSLPVSPPPPQPIFPCTLHIMAIAAPNEPSLISSTPVYRRLIDLAAASGSAAPGALHIPESPLSPNTVTLMLKRVCCEQLCAWRGVLRCGALEARVTLAPAPLPFTHLTDFEQTRLTMSSNLEICGFISMQDIGSPMALSRHLVLPLPPPITPHAPKPPTPGAKGDSETPSTPTEDDSDISKVPNFCVLLHGALKVENMAGLVQLGEDWYGLIHSWADSKKKSNLMLSALPPGDDAVPWLGPLGQLGPNDLTEPGEVFPVRTAERRSYAGGGAVWVRPAGLQADLHKLLRHARKLPDKINHFYKEVNRVRRAALALGWVEALGAAAAVLEREAATLPPAAKAPIAIAAQYLANISSRDPKHQLPLC